MLKKHTSPNRTLLTLNRGVAGLKKSAVGMWVVIGVQVVRFILLPLCGIGVITLARNFGWVGSDSLYHFVLLLQYALPSAMAIGNLLRFFILHSLFFISKKTYKLNKRILCFPFYQLYISREKWRISLIG